MKWFRLYTEIKDDPKMLELDDHQFRIWINLLSMAGESEERGVIPAARPRGLAAALHTTPEDMETAFLLFAELGMVERKEDGSLLITNFMDRQYDNPSDHPEKVAERKTRMKERQQNAPVPSKNAAPATRNGTGTTKERERNAEERLYSEDTQSIRREDKSPPSPPVGEAIVSVNGSSIFIDCYREKFNGDDPLLTGQQHKKLAEAWAAYKRDEAVMRQTCRNFMADESAWAAGHDAAKFVISPDRWRHGSGAARASPAVKNGATSSAEYHTARLDGIIGRQRG